MDVTPLWNRLRIKKTRRATVACGKNRAEQSRSGDRVQEKQGEIGTKKESKFLVIGRPLVKMTSVTSRGSRLLAQTSELFPQVWGFSSLCGFPLFYLFK